MLRHANDAAESKPTSRRRLLTGHMLDWLERGLVLTLYGWLVFRILAVYYADGSAADLVLLFSEGLVVVLILIRRKTSDVSSRPGDWLLAFSATTAPLLVHPTVGSGLIPPTLGIGVMLCGLVVQLHAKVVLGRSMGLVAAHRGLKLGGPYRLVRHPMYAGYFLTHAAFLLMNPTAWKVTVYGLCYALQIPRLLAEERLLQRDPQYRRHMESVRYRLIPGLF